MNFLKGNMAKGLSSDLYYSQPFLKDNKDSCNSSVFLKDISYTVALNDLYKIVDSCYFFNQMDFCPILVEIKEKLLMIDQKCTYLLQVWSAEGKKIFQKPLKNRLTVWAISNEYFIYKPAGDDENADCFHITNLKKDNATILLPDFLKDTTCTNLAYHDGILYVTNKSKVHIIACKDTLVRGEIRKLQYQKQTCASISPGLPIHAIFLRKELLNLYYWKTQVIVAMETPDNQLDFSSLNLTNFEKEGFNFVFKQCREVVPRDVKLDPIIKVSYIIDKTNTFYGLALRETGHFDLYWNMTLVDTCNDQDSTAFGISVSFDTLYFSMKNSQLRSIDTVSGQQINFHSSRLEPKDFDFNIIFYQNIKNSVNLFNSFTLIRTTLYVTHGQYLSLYNIQEKMWLKLIKFEEGEILKMVKISRKVEGERVYGIAILLKTGSIYTNVEDMIQNQSIEAQVIPAHKATERLKGKILKTSCDQQTNSWLYILSKDDENKVSLSVLHEDRLLKIPYGEMGLEESVDEYSNYLPVYTPDGHELQYLMVQKHANISVYEINVGNPSFHMPDQINESNVSAQINEEEKVTLTLVLKEKIGCLTGQVHTCVTMDINDHLFLVDETNFYRYLIQKEKRKSDAKKYPNQVCAGMLVVDGNFCYTLSHSYGMRSSGLRLYDINNILKKDKDTSFLLDNVQVGFNGAFDWNQDYSRISFLKSFDCLTIVPALHRNTISFIGMDSRSSYLATKVIKDKFIALDKDNSLFCWSVVTGKLLGVNKIMNGKDYSGYQIFKNSYDMGEDHTFNREWYSKILLMSNDPIQNLDQSYYLDTDECVSQVKNQTTFVESQGRQWREFRLIEIISDKEVEEHLQFAHPFYPGQIQQLFFDSKTKYMLEKLQHPRIFLYEKQKAAEAANRVRWNLRKRFSKFPQDLENASGFLQVMSPCFEYYVDLDRESKQFVIRDTFTSTLIHTISQDLMDFSSENPRDILNRFIWISKSQIKLINKEGIEKIVDLDHNFEEVEYNMIPLFENKEIQSPLSHYFTNRSSLKVSEVLSRLKRKYQNYKSAYYLDHKREPFSLYEELFTVDYKINKCMGMHISDMSFTFLHWKIMEQLESKMLTIDLIDDSQIELLCYNILPRGDTILHKLAKNGEIVTKIFETAQPDEEDVKMKIFHVPFIQNLSHKSPMHNCEESQDIRTTNTMLTYLSGYEIDHHSRAIADLLPFIIESAVPSLADYVQSRLQQTKQIKKMNKGCLREKHFGSESHLWFNKAELETKLFLTDKEKKGKAVEKPVKVQFIDMQRVYNYNDDLCDKFFGQLAAIEDEGCKEIFSLKPIQKMIEFNYPLVQQYTIKKLFIPFVSFQVFLFIYLNFVFQQTESSEIIKSVDLPLQIILGLFSLYFLKNEAYQIKNDGISYFNSIWNYIDVITPTLILSVLTTNSLELGLHPNVERTLQAIGVFFMWIKLLYFFRIFKSYGYLIRLLIMVMDDMRTFLAVFFFTIVAFSDSLLTISNGNAPENQFVFSFTDSIIYTYRITLGDFDVEKFGTVAVPLVYSLFILCTVFNTIVMLNLLIAIISETYARVKENAVNASFQEMSAMIAENSYLIPDSVKRKFCEDNRYLVIYTDLDDELNDEKNEINLKLEQLKKTSLNSLDQVKASFKEIKKFMTNASQEFQIKQEMRSLELQARIDPASVMVVPTPSRRTGLERQMSKHFSQMVGQRKTPQNRGESILLSRV